MLKTVEKLVNAKGNMKIGNHSVEHIGNSRRFYYYGTAICVADDKYRLVYFDNGGYFTLSTTRAINSYKEYFLKNVNYINEGGVE